MGLSSAMKSKPKPTRVTHDGREILSKEDWDRRRYEVWERQNGICANVECGKYIPFGLWWHTHHKKARGLGGSKRDDRLENLEGLCASCHVFGRHG